MPDPSHPTCGLQRAALQGDLSLPTRWVAAGKVSQLFIYPVKSLAARRVLSLTALSTGGVSGQLVDRSLMVVDRKGRMVTGRKFPAMGLASVQEMTSSHLVLHYPGMEDLTVSLEEGGQVQAEVWGESCLGRDLGESAGRWMSDCILGEEEGGLRLVHHSAGPSTRPDRNTETSLAPLEKPGDTPLYADGYPFLLVSAASLGELNTRMEEQGGQAVSQDRFRPNIYIDGDMKAFAEDKWTHVKIGGAVFRNVKLCTRCVFITVDPETGSKDPGGEPLKTLRTFRTSLHPQERKAFGSVPFFGVNLGVEQEGEVAEGDIVYIPAP